MSQTIAPWLLFAWCDSKLGKILNEFSENPFTRLYWWSVIIVTIWLSWKTYLNLLLFSTFLTCCSALPHSRRSFRFYTPCHILLPKSIYLPWRWWCSQRTRELLVVVVESACSRSYTELADIHDLKAFPRPGWRCSWILLFLNCLKLEAKEHLKKKWRTNVTMKRVLAIR